VIPEHEYKAIDLKRYGWACHKIAVQMLSLVGEGPLDPIAYPMAQKGSHRRAAVSEVCETLRRR
jgi:hypothetical protein